MGEARATPAGRLRAALYDAVSAAVFLPLGGLERLREEALDALDLQPGTRVLELGCGTGGITRKLLARGAGVTGVDRSPGALERAARRAPGARFVQADLLGFPPADGFGLVLLAFVLHELDADAAHHVLARARDALAPGGAVAVLDWAEPARGLPRRLVRAFVRLGEPASARRWLSADAGETMRRAGLAPARDHTLARGAARLLLGHPAPPRPRT